MLTGMYIFLLVLILINMAALIINVASEVNNNSSTSRYIVGGVFNVFSILISLGLLIHLMSVIEWALLGR